MKLGELTKKALMEEVNLLQLELLKRDCIEDRIAHQIEDNRATMQVSLETNRRNIKLGSVIGDVFNIAKFELKTTKQELRNKLKQITDLTREYVLPEDVIEILNKQNKGV